MAKKKPNLDPYISNAALKEAVTLVREQAIRKLEALKLYEPLPVCQMFHKSTAPIRLLIGSNRSGKTVAAACEVARACLGLDSKFPKEDGRFFCVGKDLDHIGQVMWRKLGRADAFRLIRDEQTKEWRAFRPWQAYDKAYKEKTKPAPPLIPPRMIKDIAWEKKSESQPSLVTLHNGWEISFYSSLGKPPQGMHLDGVWLDEEVRDEDWIPEMQARIVDRRGRIIWSATPQIGTDQLFELHERAERAILGNVPHALVEEFTVLLEDNPHIEDQAKKQLAEGLSEEDYKVRIGGEFAILGRKVYPEFSMLVHGVDREQGDDPYENVSRTWTRYAAIDPGHQICAVIFAAVPPPRFGDFVYLEDELYIPRCTATLFGEEMERKCAGKTYHAFVIDMRMAAHTELGVGMTVAQQYSEALRNHKVRSVLTGHSFVQAKATGTADLRAGLMAVRGLLRVRDDGTPKLRVLKDSTSTPCANLVWEFKRYHHKMGQHGYLDLPDQKRHNHLMDCLRYLAMYNPRYVPHVAEKPRESWVKAFLRKQHKKGDGALVRFTPGNI